jgi:hypothetical protein
MAADIGSIDSPTIIRRFHYTSPAGEEGILSSKVILPSLNPRNARYGPGAYFTDIAPERVSARTVSELTAQEVASGQLSQGQLARRLFGQPFAGNKLERFLEVDLSGLTVEEVAPNIFLVRANVPLSVVDRIIRSGVTLKVGCSIFSP